MTSHAVLLPIPESAHLPPPQRVQLQRDYSRRALRHCAEMCGAPREGWGQDEHGAPQPNQGHFWSISHKRRLAAAVVADGRVGIDVELVTPRRDDLFEVVANEAEWSLLPDRSWHSFFRVFTAKEATLKANGVGIGDLARARLVGVQDARHAVIAFDDRRFLVQYYEHADHIAAVAHAGGNHIRWHVMTEFQLPDPCGRDILG